MSFLYIEKKKFNNRRVLLPSMKKWSVVFVLCVVIVFLISSCSPQIPEVVEEIPAPLVEEVEASPEAVVGTAPVVKTLPVVEETKPAASEYSIIYPKLKYEGAYNGPLYGTSE